jgi:MFS family permease
MTTVMDDRERYPAYFSTGGRVMFIALVLTAALCTMDRMVLSLVVDPVKHDLLMTDTQIGLLQGLSFSLMYSLAGIPLGLMADRVARGKLLAAAVLIWSLGTVLCGFASSYEFFFFARMLVGTGEAALWPVAISLIGDLVPQRNRGTAIGWVIIGQLMGSSFSLIVGGHLLEYAALGGFSNVPVIGGVAPWRMLFILYGVAGALAILLLLTGTEPERSRSESVKLSSSPLAGLVEFYRFFLNNWKLMGSLFALTAMIGAVQYSGAAWNVPMLLRRFDYGPQQIGMIMGILMITAGAFGSLGGGLITKHFGYSPTKRCNILIGAYLICSVYGLLVFNPSFTVTLIVLAVPTLLLALAGVVQLVIVQDIVPANLRGVTTAISHLFTSLLGASIGPVIVAMLTQHVFQDDKMVGVSLGMVVGVALLVSVLLASVIRRLVMAKDGHPA